MKALQISSGNRLELVTKHSVKLAPWEARISVAISLVCGSDIKNIRSPESAKRVPGHEFAGVVSEVSTEANNFLKIGERVTAFPMMPCHFCENCENGLFRDCENKESLGGDKWPGSFATEVIIDARMAVVLHEELSLEQGAMLEHLCCGYRLALEIFEDNFSRESRILIIGDGPIALADLQMLLNQGFNDIAVIGKHPFRLKVAEELGASKTFVITSLVDGSDFNFEKIDICILSAPTENILLDISKKLSTGALIIEQTRFLDTDLKDHLISRGFKFRRGFAYHISDFSAVAKLMITGRVNTELIITQRIRLEDFGSTYPRNLAKHENIKVAVVNDYY